VVILQALLFDFEPQKCTIWSLLSKKGPLQKPYKSTFNLQKQTFIGFYNFVFAKKAPLLFENPVGELHHFVLFCGASGALKYS
jgi:hypothetical protein